MYHTEPTTKIVKKNENQQVKTDIRRSISKQYGESAESVLKTKSFVVLFEQTFYAGLSRERVCLSRRLKQLVLLVGSRIKYGESSRSSDQQLKKPDGRRRRPGNAVRQVVTAMPPLVSTGMQRCTKRLTIYRALTLTVALYVRIGHSTWTEQNWTGENLRELTNSIALFFCFFFPMLCMRGICYGIVSARPSVCLS